jgi:Amt family ammonium transporter
VFLAVLLGAVAYPVLGRWAWAGEGLPDYMGWLEKWGFVDFGGASVIHTFAAGLALAWAFRFPLSRPLAPAGDGTQANASLALLGLAVVWFGWFGLDLGHGGEGPGAAKLIANTLLAGAAALVATLPCVLMVWREATPGAAYARIVAGTVGGLVAISAGVAVASPAEAIFIGALAGLAQPAAYRFLSSKRIKQDAVLANLVAAHGVCGVLGTLLAGFFASPGAFSMPDSERIGVQAGGAAVILAYGLAIGLVSALSYQGGCKLLSLRKVLQRPSK